MFPSDSPLTYGARGLVETIRSDLAAGRLYSKDIHSISDVGTGCGLLLFWLSRRFPQAHCYGIDNDKIAVANARENLVRLRATNCEVHEGDLLSTLPPHSVDLVAASLPMTVDFDEFDQVTIRRFCAELPTHLTRTGLAYIAWASWAGFEVAERAMARASLQIVRHVNHPAVYDKCYWRTYVAGLKATQKHP